MFDLKRTKRQRRRQDPALAERRWDLTRQQRREQMDLIRELGQLQITPAGYVN